jgi:beta-galactosidase
MGVGNEVENQVQASMIAILKMLKEHLLTLDDTRPISYAMNPHFKYESNVDLSQVKDIQQFVDEVSDTEIYNLEDRIERIRRIAEHVDVLSCNYQEQWYPAIHEAMPDKLILGSETYQFFRGHPDQMQNFSDEVPGWMWRNTIMS